MKPNHQKTRILFFIGSIKGGGKERRLIELLTYLKQKEEYELMVVVTDPMIEYPSFYKLNINYQVIRKWWKKNDLSVFYKFYKKCRQFKPHIIHTWGRMQSLFAIPAAVGQGIPLVNSQITGAPSNVTRWSLNGIIDQINFFFSKIVLSNSQAGLNAFNPPVRKTRVIYNGINLSRFENLCALESIKLKYGISTPYAVVMVASFSDKKDYPLFFSIAEQITRTRDDISFVAVGDGTNLADVERYEGQLTSNTRIIFTGRISDVEALVNCCTVGVLFSNKISGEGISNSIIEYMSLAKPVIANDAGGTKEIVHDQLNGYLIADHTEKEIAALITGLIDDPERCAAFGKAGRRIIETSFSLNRMGKAFMQTYQDVLSGEDLKEGKPSILLP
ncbi:group 1 glycosyl transferase [Niastella yeongjuensis]|uniref:Group 1 glycosyl transferase n=1 Tax=Niastella yeongjuensis TaxID=354355 RepID=A0A1V9F394_9BACT|nr:glycosyltransferase family 4 protein [Niastella yeongjuensis]OQP52844.1 group 1 glycosyl transferase [Niastella yeongjuensis]SEP20969.1 Glycosyltransferase involved in cell wall bisynthesis [Niastella yeongjuensis]